MQLAHSGLERTIDQGIEQTLEYMTEREEPKPTWSSSTEPPKGRGKRESTAENKKRTATR